MRKVLIGCMLVLAAQAAFSQAATEDASRVQSDVRSILNALYRGDVDLLLQYSHPKGVEALGGRDRAKAGLEKAVGYFRESEMKLEELEFPSPPEFIPGRDGRMYAIVPTKSVVAAKGGRVLSWNFQLGVREPSSKRWVYLEGSRLTDEIFASWIPDFPREHKLPRVSRERQ